MFIFEDIIIIMKYILYTLTKRLSDSNTFEYSDKRHHEPLHTEHWQHLFKVQGLIVHHRVEWWHAEVWQTTMDCTWKCLYYKKNLINFKIIFLIVEFHLR